MYNVKWYVNQRVIYAEIKGKMTIDELAMFSRHLRRFYLDKGTGPVHAIVNTQEIIDYPKQIAQIRFALKRILEHPNKGWTCVIQGYRSPTLQFLTSAIAQMSNIKLRYVSCIDEALNTLKKVDPTLLTTDNLSPQA